MKSKNLWGGIRLQNQATSILLLLFLLDASLTPYNIYRTTSSLSLFGMKRCLCVPDTVYHQIKRNPKYKKREEMIMYFLKAIPLASWVKLAGGFYRLEEHASLQGVRKFLHHNSG